MKLTQRSLEKLLVKAKPRHKRALVSFLIDLEIKSKGKLLNMIEKSARLRTALKKGK